jgi:type VI secretion system protein ImpJ
LDLNTIDCLNPLNQGDVITVYVAVPKGSDAYGVSGYPKRDILKARWLAEYSDCVDEMDLDRHQEVLFGYLNIQLLVNCSIDFERKKLENDLLVVAKIIYSGMGRYSLKSDFMPSVLQLSASNWLMNELRCLGLYLQSIEKLLTWNIKNIDEFSDKLNGWRSRELLKMVSMLCYRIDVWLSNQNVDPDEIIDTIMQLIIAIRSIFTCLDAIEVMPSVSDFNDLYGTFTVVLESLKKLIHSILPMRQKKILLVEGMDPWVCSEPLGEDVIELSDLYLSVSFDENIDWIERFVKEVKLSGSNDIQHIITQALPGLSIEYCAKRMDFFMYDKNKSYFKINKTSLRWGDVIDTGKICLFVSKEFLNFDIQLMAIFENDRHGFLA